MPLDTKQWDELRTEGWTSLDVDYACATALLDVARQLGCPVASRRNGPLVDVLEPTPIQTARPYSLSAIYGLGAFPFHTDGAYYRIPPRFVLLRLAENAASDRPTELVDALASIPSQEERAVIFQEVWLFRGGHGRFLSSIFNDSLVPGHTIVRYDRHCMRAIDSAYGKSAEIVERAVTSTTAVTIHWRQKRAIVVDNWRMLHARGLAKDSDVLQRRLERVLIEEIGDRQW